MVQVKSKLLTMSLIELVVGLLYGTVQKNFLKQSQPIQAKISKSEREYFRGGAESYSSLGRVEKKRKKNLRPLLAKFACGQVSSPRLYRLK